MERRFYALYTLLKKKDMSRPKCVKGRGRGGGWVGKGMLSQGNTCKLIRVFLSLSQISAGLKTGRTPVNCLILWEFLRSRLIQMCVHFK